MRGVPVEQQGARGARCICKARRARRRRRRRPASGPTSRASSRPPATASRRRATSCMFREFFVADDALPIDGRRVRQGAESARRRALLREFAARLESGERVRGGALEQELKAFVAERDLKVGAARASAAVRRDGADGRARPLRRARDLGPRALARADPARGVGAAADAPAATLAASRCVRRVVARSRLAIAPELAATPARTA